jgi:hypothetical protein
MFKSTRNKKLTKIIDRKIKRNINKSRDEIIHLIDIQLIKPFIIDYFYEMFDLHKNEKKEGKVFDIIINIDDESFIKTLKKKNEALDQELILLIKVLKETYTTLLDIAKDKVDIYKQNKNKDTELVNKQKNDLKNISKGVFFFFVLIMPVLLFVNSSNMSIDSLISMYFYIILFFVYFKQSISLIIFIVLSLVWIILYIPIILPLNYYLNKKYNTQFIYAHVITAITAFDKKIKLSVAYQTKFEFILSFLNIIAVITLKTIYGFIYSLNQMLASIVLISLFFFIIVVFIFEIYNQIKVKFSESDKKIYTTVTLVFLNIITLIAALIALT